MYNDNTLPRSRVCVCVCTYQNCIRAYSEHCNWAAYVFNYQVLKKNTLSETTQESSTTCSSSWKWIESVFTYKNQQPIWCHWKSFTFFLFPSLTLSVSRSAHPQSARPIIRIFPPKSACIVSCDCLSVRIMIWVCAQETQNCAFVEKHMLQHKTNIWAESDRERVVTYKISTSLSLSFVVWFPDTQISHETIP